MQTPLTIVRVVARKSLPATALVAALLFSTLPRAAAYDDDCSRRTARVEHKLHEAIDRHGPYSPQADHWRRELHEARERCWRERHRWWDEHGHRWHQDHDWDDRDH